jgi:hypothetical protein
MSPPFMISSHDMFCFQMSILIYSSKSLQCYAPFQYERRVTLYDEIPLNKYSNTKKKVWISAVFTLYNTQTQSLLH